MSSVNVVFLSRFMAEMHANYICVRERKRGLDLEKRITQPFMARTDLRSQIKQFNGHFFCRIGQAAILLMEYVPFSIHLFSKSIACESPLENYLCTLFCISGEMTAQIVKRSIFKRIKACR